MAEPGSPSGGGSGRNHADIAASTAPAPVDTRYRQHRCHARLADAAYAIGSLQPTLFPSRLSLYLRCLAAEPGAEPHDLYLLDPNEQRLSLKDGRAPPGS